MINRGDKVVIIGEASYNYGKHDGKIGTVEFADHRDAAATYNVELDGDTFWFPAASVKPYVEETPWIKNTTGECPFKSNPRLLIDVKYRNGTVLQSVPAFECFHGLDTQAPFWQLDGSVVDIVAYRVVADSEGWIKNSGVIPVADDVLVDIELDCGVGSNGKPASIWRWSLNDGTGSDVAKWRFHKTAASEKAVEVADADGWIKNSGVYPVEGDAELQIRFFGETHVYPSNRKDSWTWAIETESDTDIEFWRFKQPQAEVAPVIEAPTLAQQVARLEADAAENEREMDEMREEIAFLKGKLDAIRDLV